MSSVSSLNSLLSSSTTSNTSSALDLSSLLAAATGASSVGIDVTSAVDAAVYAARAPERVWQTQQTTLQSQTTALTSIQTAVASVSADLAALNDPSGSLVAKTVTSSDTSEVSGTAGADAAPGSHLISVQNLASASSWYSSPLASGSASAGSSVFQITMSNGTEKSFTLGSNGSGSLASLAQAINSSQLGVSASVITDLTGSRLSITSQTTGAQSNFSVALGASTQALWSSASVSSQTTPLESSTFTVNDGTNQATISVAVGSTLADVANQLNGAGLNLSASVVTDASGVHLNVASTISGAVTLSSDPTISLTQSNVGQDAHFHVDGVPVVNASNTVSTVIPGVTFTLQGIPSSSATLQVAADTSSISSGVSKFVSDYNAALSLVNTQFTYSGSTSSQGVLGSDATVRSLQSALLGLTAYTPGQSSASGSITTLSALGITVQEDGSLSLDTNALNAAVASNANAVQNFFQGSALDGFAGTSRSALDTFSLSGSGALSADISSLQQEYSDLSSHIQDFESDYIAPQQTILTNMYSKAEAALQQLPTTLKQIQAQLNGGNSGN